MPESDPARPSSTPAVRLTDGILVVCLCAAWCGVCRDYRSRFADVEARFIAQLPSARFVWVDVEDEADLIDPVEADDFPTLLIAIGDEPRFFGALTPQSETLLRLIQAQVLDGAALDDPALRALVQRLRGRDH